jgi:hypothetical protein
VTAATSAAQALIIAGGAIFGVLGSLHLAYTFFTDKLLARNPDVIEAMKATSPVLTRATTMWKAWIGFNASHSLGAILLAAFTILMASRHMEFLIRAGEFVVLATAFGLAYLWLAQTYWFRIPLVGIALATACFAVAAILLVT